jgi:hypothetical protein
MLFRFEGGVGASGRNSGGLSPEKDQGEFILVQGGDFK